MTRVEYLFDLEASLYKTRLLHRNYKLRKLYWWIRLRWLTLKWWIRRIERAGHRNKPVTR